MQSWGETKCRLFKSTSTLKLASHNAVPEASVKIKEKEREMNGKKKKKWVSFMLDTL